MKYVVTCKSDKEREARAALSEAGFAILQGAVGGVGGGYGAMANVDMEAFMDGGPTDCEPTLGKLEAAGVILKYVKA